VVFLKEKKMKKVLFLSVAFLFHLGLGAQSVDEIVANYFEVIGGEAKWKALSSTRMEGKMAMQGFEFPGVMLAKFPNKQRVEVNVQGMSIVQAFDGKDAWWINPLAGSADAQQMPDDMSESFKKQEFQPAILDYKQKGHALSFEGVAEVEGTKANVLKLTKQNGDVELYYFDTEEKVLIMTKVPMSTGPMKGVFTETYYSDYQEVDGLVFPFFIEVKAEGQTVQKMTIKSVKTNVEASDSQFSFPKK
jgi:outer membrane lipoprotein-sorting protein